MHVLFLSHYTGLYGANRSLIDLILELRNSDIRPTVLLPGNGPVVDELKRHDLNYLTVPFKKSVHRRGAVSWLCAFRRHALNVLVARRYLDRFREMKIDAVHTNSSLTCFGWLLSRMLEVPHFWHVRESVAAHYKLYHDFGDRVFQQRLAASNRTIPISHFLNQELLGRVPEERKQVIYNGVFSASTLTRLASTSTTPRKNDKFTFAIVGRLEPGKNQLEAIRAAKHLVREGLEFRLVVVGDGTAEYTRRLNEQIDRLKLGDVVEMTGYLKNVDEVYARTSTLIACARHEGLGRVTIEAMARGIPVIGYGSGGTRELVDNGVNGLLYTGDETDLAQCMRRMLTDADLTARLAHNAPQHMVQFTTEHCASAFRQVLLSVLSEDKSRQSEPLKNVA